MYYQTTEVAAKKFWAVIFFGTLVILFERILNTKQRLLRLKRFWGVLWWCSLLQIYIISDKVMQRSEMSLLIFLSKFGKMANLTAKRRASEPDFCRQQAMLQFFKKKLMLEFFLNSFWCGSILNVTWRLCYQILYDVCDVMKRLAMWYIGRPNQKFHLQL